MEFPTLKTNRLHLVQVRPEHAQPYFEIMSRNDVTKYYGMDSLQKLEDASKIIDSLQNNYENKKGIRWGIILKDNDEYIGSVGLNNLNISSKRAEIGYELHPSYWSKGYTSEAVKEALRYSFEELDLNRIGAVTYPQNHSSIRLLERLGFEKEGLLREYLYQNQQSHDALLFSLLKLEWNSLQLTNE